MARIALVNKFEPCQREEIYRILIPPSVSARFNIDCEKGLNCQGEKVVWIRCPECDPEACVEVKLTPRDGDPIFYIEVRDSKDLVQLHWDFININNPSSPRFNTDVTTDGQDRWLRWTSRNQPEEKKALEAGLAPGQVRRGLRLMKEMNTCLDEFCKVLGFKSIYMEPLFYHNAITYERHGFRYFQGEMMMRWIDKEFRPGGILYNLLDGSFFRRKEFCNSVRGRSWAIHDGILDECGHPEFDYWNPPKMYRMVEQYNNVDTFPDAKY
jgi:hypothetical protein